jgi:hypothetical protein
MIDPSTYLKRLTEYANEGKTLRSQSEIHMKFVLGQQHNFKYEKSIIQYLVESMGSLFCRL